MTTPSAADDAGAPEPGHYFSEEPAVASRPSSVRLDLPDRTLTLRTDRGVFSPDRVDPGTKLLLTELLELGEEPAGTGAVLVDLGCGYGAIACTVAARHPRAEVVAVDVNRRARELCAANADAAGVEVQVLAPEEVPAELRVDHLVSNPPIRIGKARLHALLTEWLDRLTPRGVAHLVVRKQLGADSLTRWLEDTGHDVGRLRSRQGYRILEVRRRTADLSGPAPDRPAT